MSLDLTKRVLGSRVRDPAASEVPHAWIGSWSANGERGRRYGAVGANMSRSARAHDRRLKTGGNFPPLLFRLVLVEGRKIDKKEGKGDEEGGTTSRGSTKKMFGFVAGKALLTAVATCGFGSGALADRCPRRRPGQARPEA